MADVHTGIVRCSQRASARVHSLSTSVGRRGAAAASLGELLAEVLYQDQLDSKWLESSKADGAGKIVDTNLNGALFIQCSLFHLLCIQC